MDDVASADLDDATAARLNKPPPSVT